MQCLAVHLPQSHIAGMENLNCWERLKALGKYSQERRIERYMIIFIWKLAMGFAKGYTNMDFIFSPRRGWTAVPKDVEMGVQPVSEEQGTGSRRILMPGCMIYMTNQLCQAARGKPLQTVCFTKFP